MMRPFLAGCAVGVLLVPALVLAVAWLGWLPVHADGKPLAIEAWAARKALDAAVLRSAPKRENPVAPTDQALLQGMRIYRDNCSGCHGTPAQPSNWGSAHFYPRVPQFGSAPVRRPDWQIFWIVRHGLRYSGMGGWSELMSEEATWKVAAFLARLETLPPAVATEWNRRP